MKVKKGTRERAKCKKMEMRDKETGKVRRR